MSPDNEEQRFCYWIDATQTPHPERGYIPAIVSEGEAGYCLMNGKDDGKEPWYWGDLETARLTASNRNGERGLSKRDVRDIVDSSILASIKAS